MSLRTIAVRGPYDHRPVSHRLSSTVLTLSLNLSLLLAVSPTVFSSLINPAHLVCVLSPTLFVFGFVHLIDKCKQGDRDREIERERERDRQRERERERERGREGEGGRDREGGGGGGGQLEVQRFLDPAVLKSPVVIHF